jgi:hypothetical protein
MRSLWILLLPAFTDIHPSTLFRISHREGSFGKLRYSHIDSFRRNHYDGSCLLEEFLERSSNHALMGNTLLEIWRETTKWKLEIDTPNPMSSRNSLMCAYSVYW